MFTEKLPVEVEEKLQELLALLGQNEVILHYQQLAKKVKNNQELQELEEAIKVAQKETVNFGHYGQINAAKEAKKTADELTEVFNQHPQVIAYRKALYEANDLLQYLTGVIQKRVNEELQK